mmetsp:Transcript_74727/g.219009  ORF Transcript_74727/g.219009 Transcript_74727/m.219009 type:complete len:831 (+) Transcript_74727:102-2594(+)
MCQDSPPAEGTEEVRSRSKTEEERLESKAVSDAHSGSKTPRGKSKQVTGLLHPEAPGDAEEVRMESKARWEKRRTVEHLTREPALPPPLQGGRRLQSACQQELPSCEALEGWLRKHGVEATDWKQQKGGKSIQDLWKEVKLQECGMELWETASGEVRPVRVVHVLRAKVCSPESYERNIFVFNNWQQFSDGRTRTRNGLLSEKLSVAEMPLEEHLHEVCCRAVTTEEMQRVEEAAFRVGPGYASPEHDPDYVCPITVADEQYIDHSVEIVSSASYPTLMTLYHLYTVEIVCLGLPSVDFTTLEFNAPDDSGCRKLKYVHGWCWLEWSLIQRYLFEGSELKDRKVKGSFEDSDALTSWLSQFDLDLAEWGTGDWKSTEDLHRQVESGETHLEHWGRHDGVPLLMRVLHVVRLEVKSSDPRLLGKFLLQTWQQELGGGIRTVNRLMTRVMNTLDFPFDDQRLKDVAGKTVQEKLGFLVDAHFRIGSLTPAMLVNLQHSGVQIVKAHLMDHHVSVDQSPSYKGMCTLYHLYDMQVECQGLPFSEFGSITFKEPSETGVALANLDKRSVRICQGFRWVTWPSCIDIWQGQAAANQRKQDALKKICRQQREMLSTTSEVICDVNGFLEDVRDKMFPGEKAEEMDPDLSESLRLLQPLQEGLEDFLQAEHDAIDVGDLSRALPPSMVSTMSQSTLVAKETLESAALRRMRLMEKIGSLDEELEVVHSASTSSTAVLEGANVTWDPSVQSSSRGSLPQQDQVEEAFASADVRGSNTVSEAELAVVLRHLSPELSAESIQMVFATANLSKGGTICYRDFVRWLYEESDGSRKPSAAGV